MKLTLTLFLIGLLITSVGMSILVDGVTKVPAPLPQGRYGVLVTTGAGSGAGLATFGIGLAIGLPIILRRQKHN